MNEHFTYSVLKYNHSLLLGEALNVGILFHFNNERRLRFVTGNTQRVKSIYWDFDPSIYNSITKSIKNKLWLQDATDLFAEKKDFSFKEYINTVLLPEDSTALQFSNIFTSINTFETPEKAVEQFSKLLLPDIDTKREEPRRNEYYLLKKCTDYISQNNINIDRRMRRNRILKAKTVKVPFELSWLNGVEHFVKPISFDLLEEREIQDKAVKFFGYFNILSDYAKLNNLLFDILIAKPQNPELDPAYEDAVNTLKGTTAPIAIITEESLKGYSEETAKILHKKDLQSTDDEKDEK